MDMSECFGADDRIASSHDAIAASVRLYGHLHLHSATTSIREEDINIMI